MNAESVKARLKKCAVESGHTFQEVLTYYGLERTIYRISISKYADSFVLKGGIFFYAIFGRNYERATTDIDLLARRISNSGEQMKDIFKDIFSQNVDDALKFDIDTVKVENITEFKEYHGLHVAVIGYLDRTRIPIEIDIGFGDSVYPDAVKMDFPVILDMEIPKITVYSLESAIAEKMEAIISNGYLNSRYKDFYDIYVLSEKYVFEYLKLKKALLETFNNRKTSMTIESAVFSEDFINDPIHQVRWKAFLKKKKAIISISLYEVIDRIKAFYYPLIEEKKNIECIWSPKEGCWTSYDGSC